MTKEIQTKNTEVKQQRTTRLPEVPGNAKCVACVDAHAVVDYYDDCLPCINHPSIDELHDAHIWYLSMFVNDFESTDKQYLETLESLAEYVED